MPDEPIIGAAAVHRLLAGWRRELQDDHPDRAMVTAAGAPRIGA